MVNQCTPDAGVNAMLILAAGTGVALAMLGIWYCYGRHVWLPKLEAKVAPLVAPWLGRLGLKVKS